MTDGVWRDEKRLPLDELTQAMATYSADGQVDDATGGEVGPELTFGDGGERRAGGQGRTAHHPSPDGPTGPV